MVRLAQKAFHPGRLPFPLLHVNTTWKFREMIAFRDKFCRENGFQLLEYVNRDGLAAGASPHMRPLQHQTWETFSVNWQTDVRIAFHWLREALLTPLRPGSRVVVISSGAALNANGSPLSGGYAGAKATQRFITGYAQEEANRAGLDITFTTVLPQFAPLTDVGRTAVHAYAARAGLSVQDFLRTQAFPLLTPEIAGSAMVKLAQLDAADVSPAYVLNGGGLHKLP